MFKKLFYLMALILVSGIISNSEGAGLAENYPGDIGIENDPNVVFVENFEEGSIPDVLARWDDYKLSDHMSLVSDVPPPSSGDASLLMTHVGGEGDAIDLYTRLLPGFDELYFRFYVKIDTACNPIHHFVHMGGYNPPTAWPQGGAGEKPDGDDRFSTAIETHGTDWRWDYYTYWMEMRGNPIPNKYWGNDFINDSNFTVVQGQWLCVEVMVKMNYPTTERNGEQAVWINGQPWYMGGQLVTHLGEGFPNGYWVWDSFYPDINSPPFEGFRWRSVEDLNINFFWLELYITTAPTEYVSKVWFDDIVIAKEYIGPISTTPVPPGKASNPDPGNGATDISVDADLSWTAGSGSTSSDVYFGTTSPGAYQGNQTATTFEPGTLDYDTPYYWRIDEINAEGTTTGDVWTFTTESLSLNLPWTDGFESGDLVTGGWTTSGSASASSKAEYTGVYGAQLKATAWMEKAISTAGFTSIHVKYARTTGGLDSGEYLYVEYHDGSQWNELEATQASSWASQDKTCGSSADDNADFKVRFRLNANKSNEYAYIDDVEITGTSQ